MCEFYLNFTSVMFKRLDFTFYLSENQLKKQVFLSSRYQRLHLLVL